MNEVKLDQIPEGPRNNPPISLNSPLNLSSHRIDPKQLLQILYGKGQSEIATHLAKTDPGERQGLIKRLSELDWDALQNISTPPPIQSLEASPVIPLTERARYADTFKPLGKAAYRNGEVGILVVVGGQGTRLSFSGPKGCFPIMPVSKKTFYEVISEKVIALTKKYGRDVPLLMMTSPATDETTRTFFTDKNYFGLKKDLVRFFVQGTVPSTDLNGKLLLESRSSLLENPDGHGGCFEAINKSGSLSWVRSLGVKYLVYSQVDNVLVPFDDPFMVGQMVHNNGDVATKVLKKVTPTEKVGSLVRNNKGDLVVEYTEVTADDAGKVDSQGRKVFEWGSPAMFCWSTGFLEKLYNQGFRLPLHQSRKPLKAYKDGKVSEVVGCKSERFIFDLIPEASVSLSLEIDRDSEFAPVKNPAGIDSAESARQMISALHISWLRDAGVTVKLSPGSFVEISPLFADTRDALLEQKSRLPKEIKDSYYLK